MGSYLLKQSKLRADEIVHYAYQFAHEYDREYGSAGFGDTFLPQDEMLRIITDKAMNSIPNCDKDSAFRVAMSTQKILETMGITIKVAASPEIVVNPSSGSVEVDAQLNGQTIGNLSLYQDERGLMVAGISVD